jgi:hypothetical protein
VATIFPFTLLRKGCRERLAVSNAAHEQSGGRRTMQKLHAAPEFVVNGTLQFPNRGGKWSDFVAFWLARFGTFEAFLYKAQDYGQAAQGDAFVAVAAQVDFTAARRYVDTAFLVVKKNGVVQTLTTHYTLKNESGGAYVLGTSTKLIVRFVAAPGAAVPVTLAYEFYYPVRFEGDDLPGEQDLDGGGAGKANVADRTVAVQMRETGPGFSYAAAPNSL